MSFTRTRLACWLKSDLGTFKDSALSISASDDGDLVGAWEDHSGNGFHARQNTSDNRPNLRLNKVNGLPALQFNAAKSQFLSLGTVLAKPRSWSIFAVLATATPNVRQSPFGSCNTAGSTGTAWGNAVISQGVSPAGSISPDFGDGSSGPNSFSLCATPGGQLAANEFAQISTIHRDNDMHVSVFKNGAELPVSMIVSGPRQCIGAPSNFSIGREGDYHGIYLNGYIAEFMLYDTSLLPVDRVEVETYLKERYGL